MRTAGWPHPISPKSWIEIEKFYNELVPAVPKLRVMETLVASIRSSDVHDALGAFTSMHDLVVVALDPSEPRGTLEPPNDTIRVHVSDNGKAVVLSTQMHLGHNDSIERPSSDAIPLFWTFVSEKFGLQRLSSR